MDILSYELECTILIKLTLRELAEEMGMTHAITLMVINEMANDENQPDDVIFVTEQGERYINKRRVMFHLGAVYDRMRDPIEWLRHKKLTQTLYRTSDDEEYIKVNCHEIRRIFIGS